MKILNNKKYKFHCHECSSDILFSKEDCLVDKIYGDFWLNCPVCGREYDNQTYKIFRYEYIEECDEKDKEIERLENIIKEVREKLNTQLAFTSSYQLNYQSAMSIIEETKQILDKEVN